MTVATDLLLTTQEVSERFGIAAGTLGSWRTRGYGGPPYVKNGGRVQYRLSDVEEWRMAADVKPLDAFDPQDVRDGLRSGTCPFCGRGPFKMVLNHASNVHGYRHRDVKMHAGLAMADTFCDPELSAHLREQWEKHDENHAAFAENLRLHHPEAVKAARQRNIQNPTVRSCLPDEEPDDLETFVEERKRTDPLFAAALEKAERRARRELARRFNAMQAAALSYRDQRE